jgi:hypothetical protein
VVCLVTPTAFAYPSTCSLHIRCVHPINLAFVFDVSLFMSAWKAPFSLYSPACYNRGNHDPPLGIRPDDMDPALWLELPHPFIAVQSLNIPAMLEPFIAAALQGLTE